MSTTDSIVGQLQTQLWCGGDPFHYADAQFFDTAYPHTNITTDFINAVLTTCAPSFWLEIGSMHGGSAIKTATAIKQNGCTTNICCIDPFCGDVNMWAWEKGQADANEWRFLNLQHGRPTIYDRFLANVKAAGHTDIIVPIVCTSTVGIKLLARLVVERRLSRLPDAVYLDSAHEPGETLMELRMCWGLLDSRGVLMGDDWSWDAVRDDVRTLAAEVTVDIKLMQTIASQLPGSRVEGNVLLYNGQWLLAKQ